MAMMGAWFRFPPDVDVDVVAWRVRLASEIGARRAGDRNVDVAVEGGLWAVSTMDLVAYAYAHKVVATLGGQMLLPSGAAPATPCVPALWVATPWVAMSWRRRLRIWIGPPRACACPPAASLPRARST